MTTFGRATRAFGSIVWTSVLALGCAMLSATASAQGTAGRASSIVLPVAAHTSSFETEVFVRNPNTFSIDVDVLYYETIDPLNPPSPPGLKTCSMLTLAPNSVVSFKLGTQCPPIAAGSHYGLLVLRDHAAEKIHSFAAFSRVQHVGTNQGFSIEGFPEHTFSGRVSGVNGLKRIAASVPPTTPQPGYQPNCFVGSLGDAVTVTFDVQNGADGSLLGALPSPQVTVALGPYQLTRILDVYGAVGGVGDRENIRVRFDNTSSPGEPAYVAFCTEQDNLSFGADFRIAKSDDEANITKFLTRCRGTSDAACTTLTVPAAFSIPNATTKHRFSFFIHHPDFLHCDIVGPHAANLEMRLLAPNPPGAVVGPFVAGGDNQGSFYYATGPREAVVNSNGFQTFWTMEIGPREGVSAPPAFPVDYGYRCFSGSGMHGGGSFSALADDF